MVVAVAPHTSNWDFVLGVAVLFALRIKVRFLGKHTLFVPVFKHFLFYLGGIPVNRKDRSGVVDAISQEFSSHKKMILALAPEGTRSPIFPWKTGFLGIARRAQVPVLLIAFDFKENCVKIGPEIHTTDDMHDDMEKIYHHFSVIPGKFPEKCLTSNGDSNDIFRDQKASKH